MKEFGRAGPDAGCPVSLETLNDLRCADVPSILDLIRCFPELKRVRLALGGPDKAH